MANVNFTSVPPGDDMHLINTPSDAETIYVDNLVSIILDKSVAKIGFVETLPHPEGRAVARFVLNLAINRDGLATIAEAIQDAIKRTEAAEQGQQ